jgi:protein-arginine kinase
VDVPCPVSLARSARSAQLGTIPTSKGTGIRAQVLLAVPQTMTAKKSTAS